ncbi:hypothetical protein Ddye_024030 [Dipteronia dyeriana]|uniref:ATP citrate synthase n=1 Tax=Dipteronia dyeriana TaxID=168575 RepID=A0AAD9TUI6_9ROSI|nr:hypothetical protein Ddye_024030 [Dipteronia dyeriana]
MVVRDPITTFIVEPYIRHHQEYYLSIKSERLGCTINFSNSGGIEIEHNWDKVKSVFLPTDKSMAVETIASLVVTLPSEVRGKIENFILGVFDVFQDLDFSFIEMNPSTLVNGELYPLDVRGELDECAAFRNQDKWGNVEFPMPFGRVLSPEEMFIDALKEKSNATLNFILLNRKGRIWKMIPGGGSSLIFVDAVGDLGYASELGNYTDYTGTSKEELYKLAMTILNCATANPDGRKRVLLIGGNISNTANIATIYDGLIRALREKKSELNAAKLNIYVGRGGQNHQIGLGKMLALGEELGIPVEVYGPEAIMTGICTRAVECIES